jgi:hypothetical protein
MTSTCPVCGASGLRKETTYESIHIPFSKDASVPRTLEVCDHCGFDLYAEDEGETTTAALASAITASVHGMLDDLAQQGHSMAYLERGLGLPQRTLGRWKGGEISAAALTLLRTVRAFPFVVQAAEAGFRTQTCDALIVAEAAQRLLQKAKTHNVTCRVEARYEVGQKTVTVVAKQATVPTSGAPVLTNWAKALPEAV